MKLTVVKGGRDPKLVSAAAQIQRLVQRGATIKLEGQALLYSGQSGLRFTQLKTILSRFRVDRFEIQDTEGPRVNVGYGTMLEEWEDQRVVGEFALKVVVERSTMPGRVAVIDIRQLDERK